MNSTVVWIITAMLWYQGPGDYGYTNYEAKQFDGRGECLDYIWDNKADLVESCSEYMASMKMGVDSRPGASTVRQRGLTSTKCDIFATPLLYSGDLTQ